MNAMPQDKRPLDGIVVVDFSQFLSGPLCSLKLADLGARVIKVERPGIGDLCRKLYLSDTEIDGDSTLFHAINRNKESVTADLRDPTDRDRVWQLIKGADVVIQNFRPGVIERQGFGYGDVCAIRPDIIYGSISGYGEDGPWKDLPGQDLLAQARSGLLWLTGSAGDPPMPMGLAVADMLAGNTLAQGILAALVGRLRQGNGAHVQTSLFEAMIDFQFEVLTTHLNDGGRLPERSAVNGAHAYLGAPYGVYQTADSHLALAMTPSLQVLCDLLDVTGLSPLYDDSAAMMTKRDHIKTVLSAQLKTKTTAHWLARLQPADIWCSEVMDWRGMMASDAFKRLNFEQALSRAGAPSLRSLRGPLRLNGQVLTSSRAAPMLGQDNAQISDEIASGLWPTEVSSNQGSRATASDQLQ